MVHASKMLPLTDKTVVESLHIVRHGNQPHEEGMVITAQLARVGAPTDVWTALANNSLA